MGHVCCSIIEQLELVHSSWGGGGQGWIWEGTLMVGDKSQQGFCLKLQAFASNQEVEEEPHHLGNFPPLSPAMATLPVCLQGVHVTPTVSVLCIELPEVQMFILGSVASVCALGFHKMFLELKVKRSMMLAFRYHLCM